MSRRLTRIVGLRPASVSAGPSGGRVGSLRAAKSDRLLVPKSFLRRVDARTKLALAASASAAIMLPLAPLAVFLAGFAGLLIAAGLSAAAAAQVRRLALLLALLFAVDWLFIDLRFATLITLRVVLLVISFTVLVATTTPDELRTALERLGLPARLAFVTASAYRAVTDFEREWRTVIEAQRARGIILEVPETRRWGRWRQNLGHAAALVVPAIVLAVQRAWAISEAAAARGFESPLRRPYQVLRLRPVDHALLLATAVVLGGSCLLR